VLLLPPAAPCGTGVAIHRFAACAAERCSLKRRAAALLRTAAAARSTTALFAVCRIVAVLLYSSRGIFALSPLLCRNRARGTSHAARCTHTYISPPFRDNL